MNNVPKIAAVLLVLIAVAFGANMVIINRKPIIERVDPKTVEPGMTINLYGKFFGSPKKGGLALNGVRIFRENILEWKKDHIKFITPEEFDSGILTVSNENGSSGGIIIANREDYPELLTLSKNNPVIYEVYPQKGQIGDYIKLYGEELDRFRSGSIKVISDQGETRVPSTWIEHWDNNSIAFNWRDALPAGGIFLEEGEQKTNIIDFSSTESPYRKTSNTWSVIVEKSISGIEGGDVLYQPLSADYTGLREREILSLTGDIRGRKEGSWLINDMEKGGGLTLRYLLELERVSWVDLEETPNSLVDPGSLYMSNYLQETPDIPVNHPRILSIREYAQDGYKQPYYIAKGNYDYLLTRQTLVDRRVSFEEAFNDRISDSQNFVLFYTALLRNGGIPARTIAGYVLDTGTLIPHFWVEFYLVGAGWVIADPLWEKKNTDFRGFPSSSLDYVPIGELSQVFNSLTLSSEVLHLSRIGLMGDLVESHDPERYKNETIKYRLLREYP